MASSRSFAPARGGEALAARYAGIRGATEALCAPLSADDCQAQSMPDASPVKWHLAHTSWFFETFVLEASLPGYRPFQPAFRVLFNSYYHAVGAQHPRPQRGLLTRPTLEEVFTYRAHVDRAVHAVIDGGADARCGEVIELGLQHEQQHQELILTDVKHLLSCNPLRPAYREQVAATPGAPAPLRWESHPEGLRWIGHAGIGFCFDNEQPRHRVFVDAFEIASRLITNLEFLAFIEDGGYRRPELWLSDGWSTMQASGWQAPLYWEQGDGAWWVMTLAGMRRLPLDAPVCHVSFYEADAFARWAGARLPRESEWEVAAAGAPAGGNFVESGQLQPAPARGDGIVQLFGDVWEWTQSPYTAYPGYRAAAGALGEYNGKFMCNQFVLRGGSCVTPAEHVRATYRNFFPAGARWQFSGIRLAR